MYNVVFMLHMYYESYLTRTSFYSYLSAVKKFGKINQKCYAVTSPEKTVKIWTI